ncbi:MAG: hypothetical protein LC130_12025, partial [Bryobacterales bacterium]|nr:hypothetical protein [Bryobacterales bacterium]
ACITAEDLAEAAEVPGGLDEYRPTAWFSRLERISGWNAQASLPKSDVLAIVSGSAFLFEKQTTTPDVDAEIERLTDILSTAGHGIGERWVGGFGEASFCYDFHYEFRYED